MIRISDKIDADVIRGPRSCGFLKECREFAFLCVGLVTPMITNNPLIIFIIYTLTLILLCSQTVQNWLIRLWVLLETRRPPKR